MNVIDVYDIANSTWYKQSTSGESPPIRVDPCAVVAAASDGSSFQVSFRCREIEPCDAMSYDLKLTKCLIWWKQRLTYKRSIFTVGKT
jgi:hypothetical protein